MLFLKERVGAEKQGKERGCSLTFPRNCGRLKKAMIALLEMESCTFAEKCSLRDEFSFYLKGESRNFQRQTGREWTDLISP